MLHGVNAIFIDILNSGLHFAHRTNPKVSRSPAREDTPLSSRDAKITIFDGAASPRKQPFQAVITVIFSEPTQ